MTTALAEALLEGNLASGTHAATDLLPDVVASLDALVLKLDDQEDKPTLKRYCAQVGHAIDVLTGALKNAPLPAGRDILAEIVLRDTVPYTYLLAPQANGSGAITVLVDRLRGCTKGAHHECTEPRPEFDLTRLPALITLFEAVAFEQANPQPLHRIKLVFNLSNQDIARAMGVTRQAVERWLVAGVPTQRVEKINIIAQIADMLHYHLKDGVPASIVHKPAEAYGNRSMLDLFEADEHDWLLEDVKFSFNYASVA